MEISEIVIIYLAIGVPIGVYAIIRPKNSVTRNLAGILAINVLLWPVFASLELVPRSAALHRPKYLIDSRPNSANVFERSNLAFAASIEGLGDRSFRHEALEEFERFAALTNAIPSETATKTIEIGVPEVFIVAGHPNSTLAAKCLSRLSRRKLGDHRDRTFANLKVLAFDLTSAERTAYLSAIDTARTDLLDRELS